MRIEELKGIWTDKYVRVKEGVPHYQRFAGRVGRVVTVNYSGKALVDFADGGWYDIPASSDFLQFVLEGETNWKFDPTVNSAQKLPARQG